MRDDRPAQVMASMVPRSLPVSESSVARRRFSFWGALLVTGLLAASAALATGYGLALAGSQEDTEALESPLLLAVARLLKTGPGGLYGPFGGENHLVLIHAPLYYLLAALAAWPLHRLGLDPVHAALVAGRALSGLALAATLLAAYWIARLDGAPRKAGWWAVLLIAAARVLGGFHFAVRPDMLGVCLQTAGVLAVLAVLKGTSFDGPLLLAASGSLALAFCVKQTYVATAVVSAGLLLGAWRRGQILLKRIERGALLALLIVLAVYGTEEVASSGRMSQAVIVAAQGVARVHPAGWFRAAIVGNALLHWTTAVTAALAAAGAAGLVTRPGVVWKAFGLSVTALLALLLFFESLELASPSNDQSVPLTFSKLALLLVVLPVCVVAVPLSKQGRRLEAALWFYLFAELVQSALLSRGSTGSWLNYAIQCVVFAAILAGRSLARAVDEAASLRGIAAIALAGLIGFVGNYKHIATNYYTRVVERAALQKILEEIHCKPSELFFVNRPGDNRVYGRLDLVYDDWLYEVFESLRLAEPRAIWLRRALCGGGAHFVINTSDGSTIDGLPESLPRMGYFATIQVGPFYVWKRAAGSERRLSVSEPSWFLKN
jgi:hypothetical protein